MELTYNDVEELLARLHEVSDAQRGALKGRLKHFQRNGWPGGTNTGKGKRATYGFGALLKIALGFELLQLGLTPERAAEVLKDNWHIIDIALSLANPSHPPENGGQPFDVFLYCDPVALSSLREVRADQDGDPSDATFFYTSAPELARSVGSAGLDLRRLALINLTRLLSDIAIELQDSEAVKQGYVRYSEEEHQAWRASYIRDYDEEPKHESLD